MNSLVRKSGKPEIFDSLTMLGLPVVGSYLLGSISVKCTHALMGVQRGNRSDRGVFL